MRSRELLDEDYHQNLESDLNNLLIGVKGNGVTRIPTQKLVDKMQQSGYSVSADSLMLLLQDNPVVANVSQEFVELAAPESSDGCDQTQDSASQVSDMAQSATDI